MALDATKTAHEIITSGRSTGQTVIDSDGNLKWALENLVDTRLDDTGEWDQLNLASAVLSGTNVNGAKRYLITEDTSTGVNHYINRLASVTSGRTYTFSAVVQSNGRDAAIATGAAFGSERWSIDLSTLVVVRQDGTSTTSTVTATALTNGEVLIEFTATATATGNVSMQFRLWNGVGSNTNYDGDGTSGLYVSEAKIYQSTIGPRELIQNGDFASGTTDWLDNTSGTASFTVSSGVATLDRGDQSSVSTYQSFPTVVGETYKLRVDKQSGFTIVRAGPSFNSFGNYNGSNDGTDVDTSFVATATETFVTLTNNQASVATLNSASVLRTFDAMQRDKNGSNFLENETGAALYSLGVNYESGVGGMQVWEGRTNLLLDSVALATQSVTTTNVPHTLSFSGTGTVTLSGTSTSGPLVGTGSGDADRVSLTFTPTAGSLTLTVSGTVSFAQLEVGSSASPYIPTFGSTQTRGADNLSTLLSSFGYNVNEGTVVADFITAGSDGADSPRGWQLSTSVDNTTRLGLFANTSNSIVGDVTENSVAQASLNLSSLTPNTQAKVAMAFKIDDFAASRDGGAVVTDTSGNMPSTFTQMIYGKAFSSAWLLNGEIRKLAYYPKRLSNATLVEATS